MSSDFYVHGAFPSTGSAATSAAMRAELDLITAAFNKLPQLSGNAGQFIIVNPGGTALIASSSLPSLAMTDSGLSIINNADNSKVVKFDASKVGTGQTRTLSVPNSSGTIALDAPFGFKNRIINGGFLFNQRVYVSGTALAAGVYAHDRWKAGASGCTYTFSAGSAGVPVPITITAGSLQQVIEGCNLPEGGTYTMSWTGTAQGKIAGGSYAASPITITGATPGANVTVEFGTGTLTSVVQVEPGGIQTSIDYRDYGRELFMCQRYCINMQGVYLGGYSAAGAVTLPPVVFPVPLRATPTVTTSSIGYTNASGLTQQYVSLYSVGFYHTVTAGGNAVTTVALIITAEL